MPIRLLENGSVRLLEAGGVRLLEGTVPTVIPTTTPITPRYLWQVLVRNADFTIAGELDVIDIDLHPKFQDVGTWALDFAWDGNPTNAAVSALLEPGAGIVFRLNNTTVLSGPWTKKVHTRNGDERSYSVGGVDDNQALVEHVAHPQPASTIPPYLLQAQDLRGPGPAETIMKQYVDINCGPGAIPARRIPGLTVEPNLARGASVKGVADWTKQLDALIQQLGQAGGVGYRIIQTGAPGIEFQVYVPADKSSTVVFGIELGNTSGYSYGLARPQANYIYALGSGEGTARTVREGQDDTSVGAYGRIEAVSDQSNTADLALLDQQIQTELAAKAAQFSATVTALDTRAHLWAPIAEEPTAAYDLGDRVSVVVDDAVISETITELAIRYSSDVGTQVVPVVGTPMFGSQIEWLTRALARKVTEQARQLQALQGR